MKTVRHHNFQKQTKVRAVPDSRHLSNGFPVCFCSSCTGLFCLMRPDDHGRYALVDTNVYIKEGQEKSFQCTWHGYTFYVRCTDGRITAKCKSETEIFTFKCNKPKCF